MNLFAIIISVVLLAVSGPSVTTSQQEERIVHRLPEVGARINVQVLGEQAPPQISARAALVWDPITGRFLFEHNADAVLPIASITKLMTVLVVLEQKVPPEQIVTVTRDDNDPEGAHLSVPEGAEVSVRDLLTATLVASTNNTAEALARSTGLSEAEVVSRMNAKAEELGMKNTKFTDVTGLGTSNRSTARDLLLLSRAAFQFPEIRNATAQHSVTVTDLRTNESWTVENTDRLVKSDMRIIAGKTGFTESAGHCLTSLVRGLGEKELHVIVLGGASSSARFEDIRNLADWAFANHSWEPQ